MAIVDEMNKSLMNQNISLSSRSMSTFPQIVRILNRHKESEVWISSFESANLGKIVLDAGAGERRIKPHFKRNKYVSQDFGEYKGGAPFDILGTWDGEWASSGCDIISDICSIPVADNYFDLIICLEGIEHLPEPIKAIKELARILKPEGRLVITAPNMCAVHQAPYFYYSGFSEIFFRMQWFQLFPHCKCCI